MPVSYLMEAKENNSMKNFDKPEDLGCGCMGNGTTIWDRNRSQNNDYLTVAHISESGYELCLYGHKLSELAMAQIESMVTRNIRESHKNIPKWNYERIPIINKIEIKSNRFLYGVQYWTPEMIDQKENQNSDNSTSHYVALLQQMEFGEGEGKVEIKDWNNPFGDRFVVNTDVQPDYFKTFTDAFNDFQKLQ